MSRKLPRRLRFAAIFGGNRYRVPFNRGIATPVCALVRNDSFIFQTPIYQAAGKTDKRVSLFSAPLSFPRISSFFGYLPLDDSEKLWYDTINK